MMKKVFYLGSLLGLSAIAALTGTHAGGQETSDSWIADFPVEQSELSSTGRNPYFILEPGYQTTFKEGGERLVITVLKDVKVVNGVETRVVEERETKDGKLIEISRNYFAIHRRTKDVFYFGEDVDIYKNGKIANHEGAWQAGVNGAKFGLMMPGKVTLKAKFYQEVAPGVAQDRSEIVTLTERVKTPAGEFKNCIKTEETTPLEPEVKEYKRYASGVGLVQDGSLKLVKYGKSAR